MNAVGPARFIRGLTRLEIATEEAAKQTRRRAFLINRNFALLWSGQVVSVIGDNICATVLVLWIVTDIAAGQSWSSLAVTGVFLASTVPTVCFGPIAGVFADRWNTHRTILLMNLLSAALTLTLLLTDRFSPPWELCSIFAITILLSICARFFYSRLVQIH